MNRLIKAKEKKCTKQEASRIVTSKKQARQLRARSKQEAYQSATCTTAPAPAGNHDVEESPHGSASDGPTWHHRSLHITGQIARCEVDAEVGGVEDLEEQGRAGGEGGL